MRVLKFNISGEFACFRKATTFDKTTEYILTYDFLPLTALKGIIGAILGYDGLAKAYRTQTQPEYMTKLSGVGFGIVPQKVGTKMTQSIVNTTGFANRGDKNVGGVTNIIKQELLNDLCYTIYVTDEFADFSDLYDRVLHQRMKYPVVLGKKGMFASFSNVDLLDLDIVTGKAECFKSLVYKDKIQEKAEDFFNFETPKFKYDVNLPVGYDELKMYEFAKIVYTDSEIFYTGELFETEAVAILR